MANVKLTLQIEDADSSKQALGVAQEIIAMLHHRFRNTPHTIEGMANLLCPDCNRPMTVQDREIVCPACVEAWEKEFNLDDMIRRIAHERKHGAQQALEAAVM